MSDQSNSGKNKRSGVMRILGSTKITPILGLAAFLSILYYKQKSTKPAKKKALPSLVDRTAPLVAPRQLLGKARPKGPVLTRSYFGAGALLLQRKGTEKRWALVLKHPEKMQAFRPGAPAMDVLAWLKEGGGRFAMFRLPSPSTQSLASLRKALAQDIPQKKDALTSLLALLKAHGITMPKGFVEAGKGGQIEKLVYHSHYNDLNVEKK